LAVASTDANPIAMMTFTWWMWYSDDDEKGTNKKYLMGVDPQTLGNPVFK
jgi:hypothetical protein